MVEPDGLPDVEHDRLVRRVGAPRALVGVEGRRQAVEALLGRAEDHPGRGVGVALLQHHLAGLQQLAAADGRAEVGGALDAVGAVAAPGHVHAEDRARAGVEAGRPDHGERRAAQAGASLATLAHPEAVGDDVSLRGALALVPAGEVQHLDQVVGRREDDVERGQVVAARSRARDRVPGAQQAARERLELGDQVEAGRGVARPHDEPLVGGVGVGHDEAGRPRRVRAGRAGPVPDQVRPGEELVGVLAEQRHAGAAERRRVAARSGRRRRRDARPQDPREEVAPRVELEGQLGGAVEAAGREEHVHLPSQFMRTPPGVGRRAAYVVVSP